MLSTEIQETLKTIPEDKFRSIPSAICQLLIKKNLSFTQAEALLEYSKDLLKNVII